MIMIGRESIRRRARPTSSDESAAKEMFYGGGEGKGVFRGEGERKSEPERNKR